MDLTYTNKEAKKELTKRVNKKNTYTSTLLILHGGPGSRSCGMIPGFSLLAAERPIIFYDQLGSGNSDRPTDTALWKTERFVNEIDHLRKAINLDELHIQAFRNTGKQGSLTTSIYFVTPVTQDLKMDMYF